MLDAMSKILGFTMEEKAALGIVQKQSLNDNGSSASAGGASINGISDSLINFLLEDEDDE